MNSIPKITVPKIIIRNLSKKYKHQPESIFTNIGLEIEIKKLTCIIGESGSGKSTLLHLIGGIDKPCKGEIKFPYYITQLFNPLQRAKGLGFIFQNHYLIDDLNVLENVMCSASILHNLDIAKKNSLITLEEIGILHLKNKMPNQLSGGEQQRVAIARAIVNSPKFLLADEPTGNLDANNANKILELFLKLKSQGMTIIIVTHSEMIYSRADTIYQVQNGNIIKIKSN